MQLKTAILHSLARDDLKQILDDLGVDRRSVDDMRTALGRTRRLSLEGLVGYLRKDSLRAICEELGLAVSGTREALVQRLLAANPVRGIPLVRKPCPSAGDSR